MPVAQAVAAQIFPVLTAWLGRAIFEDCSSLLPLAPAWIYIPSAILEVVQRYCSPTLTRVSLAGVARSCPPSPIPSTPANAHDAAAALVTLAGGRHAITAGCYVTPQKL